MREIKFRAWDKKNNRMVSVWDIGWKTWDDDGTINYVTVEHDDGTYDLLEHEVELLQFTGLHDKNGKEIYEGDVVKPNYSYPTLIKWNKSLAMFAWEDEEDGGFYEPSHDDWYGCEIIGNIYENPDLWKKK